MPVFARVSALNQRSWILLLILIAVSVRLLWAVAIGPGTPSFDERAYAGLAWEFDGGPQYIDSDGPDFWPVGYPAALAAAWSIFGRSSWVAIWLNVICACVTCVLVSRIGSMAFGASVGRTAALLSALYPNHIYYTTLWLTEPLFTVLLTAVIALLLSKNRYGAAAGLGMGLAALTRPVAVMLPLMALLWFLLQGWRRSAAFAQTLLLGACALVGPGAWALRTYHLTGRCNITSSSGSHNFWVGNYPGALGGYHAPRQVRNRLREALGDRSLGYRLGFKAIMDSPGRAVMRVVQKLSYFFALETDGALWNLKRRTRPLPVAAAIALLLIANAGYMIILAFALLGLICAPWKSPPASLFLLLTGCLVFVSIVMFGDPRYHYPLIPLACIFAAKGFLALRSMLLDGSSLGRRRIYAWAALMSGFVLLMGGNLILKALESRFIL